MSPAVDPQSTTVEMWVEAANPDEKLRPGGTVHVHIVADTIPNAILVPSSALYPSQEGGSAVILIEDGAAKQQKVEVGIREGDSVQILSALEPGARVVTEGGLGLEDGAKVSVEDPGNSKSDANADDEKK